MAKIKKIEPVIPSLPTRKKVAAYARISMETDRMSHSLSTQISYYSELIQSNPEWEYVGVYSDNFISGTSTKKRDQFRQMIADCEAGKIDIILTKSISRFARNTVDLLETVRHLKEIGVEVRFEKEHINSLSGDGEVMLTLLASFAQEESRSISENVKWGTRKRMEQGIPNGKFRVYGYDWEDDHLVIVPEEAAIVKRIFQNFLDGKSRLETERELNGEGITTRGGYKWCDSNIKVILGNITYTGNLLLQKEYIEDPITKKRRKNRGALPQYFVENTHEAIIDMETYQYVQDEMARRRELGPRANKSLNLTCFSGMIKCPYCGYSYMHNIRTKNGNRQEYWNCGSKKKKKVGDGCPVKGTISHKSLVRACCTVLDLEEFDDDIFLEKVDHIEVPKEYVLDFFLKDGTMQRIDAPNTGHQDCWTAEYRARVSKQRRKKNTNPKGKSCFTSKIKCTECGNNFRRQSHRRSTGELYHVYACATTNTCPNHCIHEDTLKEKCAEALELNEFDEEVFTEQIETLHISADGAILFTFKDGHTYSTSYSFKIRMPAWTEERKKKQSEALKGKFTPERRAEMSERMKQIRKEKYWWSTGKSRQSRPH